MSEPSSNFPWAGVAVVVALVSSTLLAPHVFQQLRPPEKERSQPPPALELEVDARLWEDPFAAMRRAEAERIDRCAKRPGDRATDLPSCLPKLLEGQRNPATFVARLKDTNGDSLHSEALLLVALVPGNPFVGAEESRRRTRYAVLAGLQAKNYVPENPERIGLLQFKLPTAGAEAGVSKGSDSAAGAAHPCNELLVPYELLSQPAPLRGDKPPGKDSQFAQVALLWVDETALPAPKLDNLARLVHELNPSRISATTPQLAVIGPSSSDALRQALRDLRAVSSGSGRQPDDALRESYATLAGAQFLNAAATAADNQLDELNTQKLETFLTERFNTVAGGEHFSEVRYRRLLASDSQVLKKLVRELDLRLAPGRPHRVVLVAERDSLYAQALVSELKYRMRDFSAINFEVSYYFRGIDGVTTRDRAEIPGGPEARSAGSGGADAPAAIEWPESRDQLDYLRRMAGALKDSESASRMGPIDAIGILGSDVHDKLLVLQALHDTFADKVFFTTDMDARYLHPRTSSFTRNLIVASSLPLRFPGGEAALAGDDRRPLLQGGNPPFRDMYQSAAYLAARLAACRTEACAETENRASRAAIDSPSIYEIGRNRAVPLAGYAFETRPLESHATRAIVAGALFALLAGLLLMWPSTPALRRLRAAVLRRPRAGGGVSAVDAPTAAMVSMHAVLLAYTLGSLVEFVEPGYLGFIYIVLLASVTGFVALLQLFTQAQALDRQPWKADDPRIARRSATLKGLVLLLLALAWAWMAMRAQQQRPCLDCEQVVWLEGVSAWPSHLIHLLTLFVIAFALDWAWTRTAQALSDDSDWLKLRKPGAGGDRDLPAARFAHWPRFSVLGWRGALAGDGVDFARLWREYVALASHPARTLRTLVGYLVTTAAVALLFFVAGDGEVPALPVRGTEHRALVGWTLYACLLLLPLLMVAVADATLLTCRFIAHLNPARTAYPVPTLREAAGQFGAGADSPWLQPLAADPARRSVSGPDEGARHTLLDDWLDVQLVARRTEGIARLVIWPFAALALLVVARSRLFDNWAITPAVMVALAAYLLWLIVLAYFLKRSAEGLRRRALASMRADLRWLAASKRKELVEPFRELIAAVENNRRGAFAGLLDQPLLTALLVPLGGAGGAQLIDRLLLAR